VARSWASIPKASTPVAAISKSDNAAAPNAIHISDNIPYAQLSVAAAGAIVSDKCPIGPSSGLLALIRQEPPSVRWSRPKLGSVRQAFLAAPPGRSFTMIVGAAERFDASLTTSTRILPPISICPFSLARRAVDVMVGLSLCSCGLKN
jgi:hypothetical protein